MKPTLSSVLSQHLEPFLADHKIPPYQLNALKSYRACRTPLLGSHSRYCENGHLMGVWYSSCKRRGCAQCQGLSNARWLAAQKERLLSVTHHHWIFTLPHDLLDLWRYNRAIFQDVLFRAVAGVLTTLSRDPKYLGAQPGFVLTLHTWGRNLSLHPHIHCLITHGGLRDGEWIEPRKSVLFPARVMMQLFRRSWRRAAGRPGG
ncbi:MAG: transposase zinc-binding domain-containing protein [Proteobacteria bacterium]|nr:transposase zinc-binding domain-containing protein [Pseudomonadota bacterium]MDA1301308.1 transposase zinc-binding domain-containing protein [Pseudomonadota bacterium]